MAVKKSSKFEYEPSKWVPFRDKAVIDRVRRIKRADMAKHPNPDYRIRIVPDEDIAIIWIADMFHRIKTASDEGRRVVLILPNPARTYRKVAYLINKFRVDCRNLYTFCMDEYADEHGNIAPENYPQGFLRATKTYLYAEIDRALRPPEDHIVGFTNKNIAHYGKMIEDVGGADACYSGPGWTGHLAFIEPDAPEFAGSLEAWKKMGARVVTLSPFTIAQNSLHGSFGMCGDLAFVPPKAATIGPAEVIAAKNRMDFHRLKTAGTNVSWQRMVTRLCLHGPVTPKLPTSLLQLLPTDVYVSESSAQDIEPVWDMEY